MHSVSKNLQRDEEPGERDPKQRPLQGAFLIPPVLPVVLIVPVRILRLELGGKQPASLADLDAPFLEVKSASL